MKNVEIIFYIYLILINLLNFILFGIDKYKAIKGKYRISERTLFTTTLLGGFLGGIFGMIKFGHKTIKTSFQIVFWSIVLIWLAIMFLYMLNINY